MRAIATIILSGSLLAGIAQASPSDSFRQLINDYEAYENRYSPLLASSRGDQDAARIMPDAKLVTIRKQYSELAELKKRIDAIDCNVLEGQENISCQVFAWLMNAWNERNSHDEWRFAFDSRSGFFSTIYYAASQTVIRKPQDADNWLARLADTPRYMDENLLLLEKAIQDEWTQPESTVKAVITQLELGFEQKMEEHRLLKPLREARISEQKRIESLKKAEKIVEDDIIPSYRKLVAFLKEKYLPAVRSAVGVHSVPGGKEYYKSLVRYYTTLPLTPDEVHNTGLSEVKRIRDEMKKVINEAEFEGSFADFLDFLRTDPQFYAASTQELLMMNAWIAKQADGKMPDFFGLLPRLPYGVKPMPEAAAAHGTTAYYSPGNPKRGIAGFYVVNTSKLEQRPLYEIVALTLHEGVPGHHHQISIASEMENVPQFRKDLYINAFGEGWGLYSESLGYEMGLYKTAYDKFGQLSYEMWRACRLVADTGLHFKGWTREQAEACFRENSSLSDANIRAEVERYISWPGQALAYKTGELLIQKLRRRAEEKLGDKFDLRAFHDAVLENGTLPLSLLEKIIDKWIAQQASA